MPNLESIIKKFKSKNLVYPILFFSLSCGNNESGNPVQQTQTPNKSPETTIKSPQNNSTINSKTVIAEWSGYDSDGSVVGYLFSLDNAIKIYQEGTSKSFNNLSEGLHSLEVASRDDKGQNDLTPAHVSFTVKTETIGQIDNTNSAGYAKIEIGQNVFDVYVKNLSNQPLNNIKVSGYTYLSEMYGFLAEDFSGNYLTEVAHYGGGLNKTGTVTNPEISIFAKAKENNRIRKEKLFNYRKNKGILQFKGTTSLSDLHEFYKKYDSIFNSMSFLEFIVKNSGAGNIVNDSFTFALQAAKFREEIINNASNVGKIINTVASYFGQEYDTDAYYFDVYIHKNLGILVHDVSETNYCTLKGKITNSNNQPINNARITLGSGIDHDDADSNGDYVVKLIFPSSYTVTAAATGYQEQTKYVNIIAATSPYYTSTKLNFQLEQSTTVSEETKTFQPGSEGLDAFVEKYHQTSNFGNDPSLFVWDQPNMFLMRSFIKFDLSSMPSYSQIKSAKLYLNGISWHTTDPNVNPADVSIKKVNSSWQEQSINWNNQPIFGETLSSKAIGGPGWYEFDITPTATKWLNGTETNYGVGVVLTQETGDQRCTFFSSDVSGIGKPKLVVTYRK
ncbi:MAG: Cell wall-associated protein [archaeon GW2011_AR20]|nr:MAG: Cell wall-associated protein [archaeon GW2011_AR20]AQS28455.1 hypothetical protein [uncultured archaeon]MBS3160294.1 DNRLRE domain-containing protein [Candidatus Woesearchaeota archaeon]